MPTTKPSTTKPVKAAVAVSSESFTSRPPGVLNSSINHSSTVITTRISSGLNGRPSDT